MNKKNDEIYLGGCYHTGKAYVLGYRVSGGAIEMCDKLFTNLDTGMDGGAMEALRQHRISYDQDKDLQRFVVALKPIEIIPDVKENEEYKLNGDPGCDNCGIDDRITGEKVCHDCSINEDEGCTEECCSSCSGHEATCEDNCIEEICSFCDEQIDNGCCSEYNNILCRKCDIEFCEEFVDRTFGPMNAFARAQWLNAHSKRDTNE